LIAALNIGLRLLG